MNPHKKCLGGRNTLPSFDKEMKIGLAERTIKISTKTRTISDFTGDVHKVNHDAFNKYKALHHDGEVVLV